jgi:hypothetical protein
MPLLFDYLSLFLLITYLSYYRCGKMLRVIQHFTIILGLVAWCYFPMSTDHISKHTYSTRTGVLFLVKFFGYLK